MQAKVALLAGIGLGTGLMFLLDPDRGKRRRAVLRDRTKRITRTTQRVAKSVDKTAHDLAHHTQVVVREMRTHLNHGSARVAALSAIAGVTLLPRFLAH